MAGLGAPEVSTKIFGGVFDIDGSGMYPGLELINLVICTEDGLLPTSPEIKVKKVAHDFLRRLIHDEGLSTKAKESVLYDEHSQAAVSRIFRSLELDVPNLNKAAKSWGRAHFFPYTRSLVHWDAKMRGSNIVVERMYLRGAGAYAYSILRKDSDLERLNRRRAFLDQLYPKENTTPLDMLASTLKENGHIDQSANVDQIEKTSVLHDDSLEELYRDGVDNIISHLSASVVERVKALMVWTGLWSVIMMNGRSSKYLGETAAPFLIDCSGTNQQLRRASQRSYKSHVSRVEAAINKKCEELQGEISKQNFGKIRGFFGNTVVGCGLGNAWKGRRHYTLKLSAIDALVMAGVPEGKEMEFEAFLTEWLYQKCNFLIGRSAARQENLLNDLDASIFESNEKHFSNQMISAGMIRVFSDATRMVSYGGGR